MKKLHIGKVGIIVLIILGVLSGLFVFAYSNGKNVVSEPYTLWVSHTEYWSSDGPGENERASTIVRITDYKGEPFNIDSCVANIFYPDKTLYITEGAMQQSGISGNWYRTDPIPTFEGTYEQEVICTYGNGKTVKTSQSFHVNPALNFIKNVSSQVLSSEAYLQQVNISLTGTVENAKADLSTQLTSAETNLDGLMNQINSDLSTKIDDAQAALDTSLSNVNVSVTGTIQSTGQQITTTVNAAETNLTNLLNDVNTQLQAQLTAHDASVDTQLADLEVTVTGSIDAAKVEILSAIDASNTNLNSALSDLETNLNAQLTAHDADMNADLSNVNLTITTQLSETQQEIQTQLTNVNASVSELVATARDNVLDYMSSYLPQINETVSNVYNDTQWLVGNAMNQEDKAEIDSRFNTVDASLAELESMCGSSLTNSSDLCQEVYALRSVVDDLRVEQTQYYTDLDATTTNTWNLLSGQIATNLDEALTQLGIIRQTTEDINATVNTIRQDQIDQVHIQIIT